MKQRWQILCSAIVLSLMILPPSAYGGKCCKKISVVNYPMLRVVIKNYVAKKVTMELLRIAARRFNIQYRSGAVYRHLLEFLNIAESAIPELDYRGIVRYFHSEYSEEMETFRNFYEGNFTDTLAENISGAASARLKQILIEKMNEEAEEMASEMRQSGKYTEEEISQAVAQFKKEKMECINVEVEKFKKRFKSYLMSYPAVSAYHNGRGPEDESDPDWLAQYLDGMRQTAELAGYLDEELQASAYMAYQNAVAGNLEVNCEESPPEVQQSQSCVYCMDCVINWHREQIEEKIHDDYTYFKAVFDEIMPADYDPKAENWIVTDLEGRSICGYTLSSSEIQSVASTVAPTRQSTVDQLLADGRDWELWTLDRYYGKLRQSACVQLQTDVRIGQELMALTAGIETVVQNHWKKLQEKMVQTIVDGSKRKELIDRHLNADYREFDNASWEQMAERYTALVLADRESVSARDIERVRKIYIAFESFALADYFDSLLDRIDPEEFNTEPSVQARKDLATLLYWSSVLQTQRAKLLSVWEPAEVDGGG